jgi:DNA (cytosine-5)-methyltransferase 1
MSIPIAVDLFSGAGGLSLGFFQAGFDLLASVEIDPINCQTHERNFPYSRMFCTGIESITGREIRDYSSIKNLPISVVFGGSPCQGFSLIGKRCLEDKRNQLIYQFSRIVHELNADYFCLENVPGIAQGKFAFILEDLIKDFVQKGYEVVQPFQILNAANYGVPQSRRRLFLIGGRKGLPLPKYPSPVTFLPAETGDLPRCPTVWDAIRDLPEVSSYPELYSQDWLDIDLPPAKSAYVESLRDTRSRRLTGCLRTHHKPEVVERFFNTMPGEKEPISRFFRLHPNGISNTLRAGSGSHTACRPIHPYQLRVITVREAARLHSFPDWFQFHPSKLHGFRQVGNSVPPSLAFHIAKEIVSLCK